MALSRIGLWSFDLCQLKELQQALDSHPEKNALCVRLFLLGQPLKGSWTCTYRMALQFSLQNALDLIKYVVTIVLHRPSQFKCASTRSAPVYHTVR